MSSAHENTVFDFDLDFLNQPSTNNAEPDLQAKSNRLRKSIIFLKQRITKIDKLTVAAKNVKKENEDLCNSHMQLKQQCGQHLIEISYFIGKVTKLENEIQAAETREREKTETICELENKILALESVINQLKILDKERTKIELTPLKVETKKGKPGITNNAKKELEKEVETLRKDNAKILNLEKENEKLRKENARIPNFEKEIENLRKKNSLLSKSDSISHNEIARIQKLEKEIEHLYKENAKIPNLEKEIENLQKENFKIPKLRQEIENLQKDNAIIPKLVKEIENLQKENAKVPKLVKEIEILRKENAKIKKLGNDETVFKQTVIISNLEKDIETLRIKNAKIEIDKALSRDIVKIPNKGKDIETRLTDPTSTTKEKGNLRPRLRKYKSLPNIIGEWTDSSEAENNVFEDPLLSPTRNDTITAKKYPIADIGIAVTCESDNDNSNEVASVDTGRGSSLTTSDTDKGLHSPEYFLNCSPSNEENIENKARTKDTTMTSSILLEEIETPTITIDKHNENQNDCEANSTSYRKIHSKLMSTFNQTNTAREVSHSVDTPENVSPKQRIQSVQEKECLDMNNRLQCESHTDLELENIFSTMKLNYNAVSPIPRTPMLVHEVDSTSSSSELNENFKKFSVVCYKTVDFVRILMGLVLKQSPDNNSSIINKWDKLIESFQSISNSEHSKYIADFNMEMSDCIQNRILSHDDNGLGPIPNSESTTSSSEKETEIFQNKNSENLLTENVSLSMLQKENLNQLPHDDNNSVVTISNPSLPDKDTNILGNNWVEKQLLNHSVCEELAMDSEISEVTDSVRFSRDVVEINQPPIKNSVGKKAKNKKITKLEKLKKKLKPKYKIKMESESTRIKPKQIFPIKKKVSVNDTSATLNDKEAYEKAVKFMAEMKSQQGAKAKSPKHTKVLMSPTRTACLRKDINSSSDNQVLQDCSTITGNKRKFSELFNSCNMILEKDPLLLSPSKAQNSTTHKAEEDNNSATHSAKEDTYSSTHRTKEDNNTTTHRTEENNNSTTHRVKEDSNSITHTAKADNNSTTHSAKQDSNVTIHRTEEDNNSTTHRSKYDNNSMIRREKEDNNSLTHRAKEDNNSQTHKAKEDNSSQTHKAKEDNNSMTHRGEENSQSSDELPSKKRRRRSSNEPLVQYKRVLRSTTIQTRLSTEDNIELSKSKGKSNRKSTIDPSTNDSGTQFNNENTLECLQLDRHDNDVVSYGDLNVFSEDIQLDKKMSAPVIAKEDNNSTTHRAKEDSNTTIHRVKEDNDSLTHRAKEDNNSTTHRAKEDSNTPIHRAIEDSNTTIHRTKEDNDSLTHRAKEDNNSMTHNGVEGNESSDGPLRKRRRRSSNQPLIEIKTALRSAPTHTRLSTEDIIELSKPKGENSRKSIMGPSTNESDTNFNKKNTLKCQLDRHDNIAVSYDDLDVFSEDIQLDKKMSAPVREVNTDASACHPEESILCYMIQKHAREVARSYEKKISDIKINKICEKLERDITTITETNDCLNAMNNFVADLRKLNVELFIEGLIKYLEKPERKFELLGKVVISPFSAMTKAEHILIYAIQQLETHWPSIVDDVLYSIEFTLFKLNRTPEFDVVESLSHFYALLCKNHNALRRLKTFMLDAMYCIQFKSVPLIKQCLEVWKDLIPLPHMAVAKRPIVTCFIYLLHFYKCEDKLNRVQEIRNILRYRYHYQITNWNEKKILEMFKNCIKGLKDISQEKKELRLTLIILAKRNGPKWCQNHIIKNLLQPMIEKENVPNYVKEFCVSLIGPLMKPYPADMKVHCEIAIMQLVDILNNNPSPEMEEAAIMSMMYINRHDQRSINKMLLSRKMKPMSLRLEEFIRDYVKSKPLKIWKTILLNKQYAYNTLSVHE